MMRTRHSTSPVVLGVCAYTHDSAAALIMDGELVGFAEEERLNGHKHTKAYPGRAIAWLLESSNLVPEDVDLVGYNFQAHRYLGALTQAPAQILSRDRRSRVPARARSFATVAARTRTRTRELAYRFPRARVAAGQHHRAHGLYAFASAGYEHAAVLVADSLGELQSTTIGYARRTGAGTDYRIIDTIDDPASLGYAYGAVTEHLGWRRGDEEGTVMALAALGDPARFRDLFTRAIPLTDTGFTLDPALLPLRVLSRRHPRIAPAFAARTCPPRHPDSPVEQVHHDLAAALQERTEQVMLHLARRARDLTGSRWLCLGGGVATNCVAVGKIVDADLFDEVHVPPAPGDAGTAIGAALAAHLSATGTLPTGVAERCYLGPAHPGLRLPASPRPGLAAHQPEAPARFLARQLADGRIAGLFHGRLEAGPRALGNRSILASPLLPDVVSRLNDTVKFREPFRPFAPVVLGDAAAEYFTVPQPTPYMSIASGVTDLARDKIPAIVHANATARVQTVTPEQNPFLAEVLSEFAAITGVPVLINTSLNVKGKPICGTPEMALDCLVDSGLDALMLEGWWVTK
ncbi:carbamoyltransferase C-terminal domain-containing protein [Amycolatopsis sp. NPDC049688]|uniref:carbamoyltransferase family protein n=1 Tax=Amycolatopsis sp. NPDC049688 TaxID=3154733 RepID=UPI003432F39C